MTQSAVAFLQTKFPGQTEQEYRSHLGSFGITGLTGLQKIGTLSGGQKSRVAFAVLSMQRPHVLLLDEVGPGAPSDSKTIADACAMAPRQPSNHLDIEGIDALIEALKSFKGGVISISHDERFIRATSNQLWVCAEGHVQKFLGDVEAYKSLIVDNIKAKLRP